MVVSCTEQGLQYGIFSPHLFTPKLALELSFLLILVSACSRIQ